MPRFDPPTYTCYLHPIDLTHDVEVEALKPAIVYGFSRVSPANAPPPKGPTAFVVAVQCPGTGPDDGPHEVVASGTWRP
ncbi:MAG: hypothetical protein KJ792_10415 [Actinobacteria bacterium]|nr:hypothetical protein [Actinomycetota bacterium]MCG2802321.1 hypothetical protein [Cellulomonas sp.]